MLFTQHLTTLSNKMRIYFTILKGPRIQFYIIMPQKPHYVCSTVN